MLANGYRISGDPDVLRTCEIGEIHGHVVEIRRLVTGAALHPTDKWITYVVTRLAAVESTLELLVARSN
ncbi:hypothetical protein [Streptomyces sp. NPDC005077]|uniref:hypothetical protein n=1 Tax=Streptomyces sp. NPDC005077 TaxID=3154292 RepID=UPI0033B1BD31